MSDYTAADLCEKCGVVLPCFAHPTDPTQASAAPNNYGGSGGFAGNYSAPEPAPPSREAAIAALATTVRYPLECAASYDANGETVGIRLHARDAQKALTALSSLLAQLQQAQQQIEWNTKRMAWYDAALQQAREALQRYGQHEGGCAVSVWRQRPAAYLVTSIVSLDTDPPPACTCGLDAGLKAGR